MNICFASSECSPYAKTGGLADVAAALPRALAALGHKVKIFLPLYKSIDVNRYQLIYAKEFYELPIEMGDYVAPIHVWYTTLPRSTAEVYFIDYPPFYHRGTTYTNDADEGERFILLQRSVFAIMQRYAWKPDILHCNDWQTALMPAMRAEVYDWDDLFKNAATVLTLHNVGYQGRFSPSLLHKAGLSYDQFYPGGPMEYYGAFNFLKTGIEYADMITAVSHTYAAEIQTPAHGEGLDEPLRRRAPDVVGITNGVDVDEWNPETDPHIYGNYSFDSIHKKSVNKKGLLKDIGLSYDEGVPTMGIVSRLVDQKGFDLLHPILEPLLTNYRVQLVVLGSGQDNHESLFRWAQERFPEKVRSFMAYDEDLAHKIEAGADIFLMPSQYEPCGLNQMYSLRYGTVPVVRKTGGLADTVFDFHELDGAAEAHANGFSFYDYTPMALYSSIVRAISLFPDKQVWRILQRNGMSADYSWHKAARQYEAVYHRAVTKRSA